MKSPYEIIIRPHITEKSMAMSYGDPRITDERKIVRKYTFIVSTSATKIDIKRAIETIYNTGKKDDEKITVTNVHTIKVPGKTKRVRTKVSAFPKSGSRPDKKKAVITLGVGQLLEDYGV